MTPLQLPKVAFTARMVGFQSASKHCGSSGEHLFMELKRKCTGLLEIYMDFQFLVVLQAELHLFIFS